MIAKIDELTTFNHARRDVLDNIAYSVFTGKYKANSWEDNKVSKELENTEQVEEITVEERCLANQAVIADLQHDVQVLDQNLRDVEKVSDQVENRVLDLSEQVESLKADVKSAALTLERVGMAISSIADRDQDNRFIFDMAMRLYEVGVTEMNQVIDAFNASPALPPEMSLEVFKETAVLRTRLHKIVHDNFDVRDRDKSEVIEEMAAEEAAKTGIPENDPEVNYFKEGKEFYETKGEEE